METKIATLISYLLHPVLIPLYAVLFLLNSGIYFSLFLTTEAKLILIATFLFTTIILPLLIMVMLNRKKIIKSFFMETREERIYPLLIITVFYYLTYYLLKGIHVSFILSFFMLGSTFLAILALIITFYLRVSLHMLGMGGLLGMLTGLGANISLNLFIPILVMLFLSGLAGFARLKMDSHKPVEIYTGFLLGGVVMFILFYLI
jgi:hypothetical protein